MFECYADNKWTWSSFLHGYTIFSGACEINQTCDPSIFVINQQFPGFTAISLRVKGYTSYAPKRAEEKMCVVYNCPWDQFSCLH